MARNAKKKYSSKKKSYTSQENRNNCRSKSEIRNLRSDEDTSKSGNDPAWYASNPILLRDAASYPFSFVTGASNIHDPSIWKDSNIEVSPNTQVPGIASYHIYPTVGTSMNATDPINVASQSVYSFVRHANSGHSNYDPADLMIYIMAMANMYSFLVWCQRLYGYALTYDQRNRYIPKDLIRTNNVDADDLTNNLANFRFWINTLIAKMVSFAVPATMSVFSRMSFMYSDYYIEGTSIKEQLYQFVPDGFYKFGLDEQSIGNLTWEAFDWSVPMTVSKVMEYGETMFNAIWSQEDFGIMSGDILKAYGDNIIKLSQIPEAYSMVPKFDPMVLTQMKNADLVRVTPTRIAQSTTDGSILQRLSPKAFAADEKHYNIASTLGAQYISIFNAGMMCTLRDYNVLTVDTDQPTPDVVIEATRLKIAYDAYKGWYKCGTEIVTKVTLTTEPGEDMDILPIVTGFLNQDGDVPVNREINKLNEVARNFHFLPKIWIMYIDATTNKLLVNSIFDIDNFTVLSNEDIIKLHEAATVNMFAVPSIGKV